MVFKSDRQRKGFFGSRGNPRSNSMPTMTRSTIRKLPPRVTGFISKEISRQRKEGRPQAQSIAIAFSKAKSKFPTQKANLTLKGNPNGKGLSLKKITNLLVLLFGVSVALSILRRARQ